MKPNNSIKFFIFSIFLLPYLGIGLTQFSIYFTNQTIKHLKNVSYQLFYPSYSGSGIAVKIKNKNFLLTNRHVCSPNGRTKPFVNVILNNDNGLKFVKYYYKDVLLSPYGDLCLIPVGNEIASYSMNDNKSILKKYFIKLKSDVMITKNYSDKMMIKYGKNLELKESEMTPNFKARFSTLKIIPGDSGSPIFDNHLRLKSLAFATLFFKEQFLTLQEFDLPRRFLEQTTTKGMIVPSEIFQDFINNYRYYND